MIFRIRLPRLEELLADLGADDEPRGDTERFPIPIQPPPNHECSCTCSSLNVNTTWRFVWAPIII